MWHEHSLIGTKLHDARIRLAEANAEIARSQGDKSASKAANFIAEGKSNIMVGIHGDVVRAVPLADLVGVRKNVPLDHTWLRSVRDLEICLGD